MTEIDVLQRLQDVFDRVFVEPPQLRMDLTAAEVPEWDSVKHVELLLAVEKEFNQKFSVGEAMGIQQVGDWVRLLAARTAR